MRHTDYVRATIHKNYFDSFFRLKEENPGKTNRELWLILEASLDHDMYSSYESFRVNLHLYQKKQKTAKS